MIIPSLRQPCGSSSVGKKVYDFTVADGFELRVKVRIKYIALFILALLAGVACLTYVFSRAGEDLRKTITFGSSLFGAAVGISTLFYTAQNIRRTNDEKQSSAATRFVERWNDPGFFEIKSRWRSLNEELQRLKQDERNVLLSENLVARTTAIEVLNFFEEMSVAINTGSVDQALLQRFFRTMVLGYWEQYRYWIEHWRQMRNAPRFCIEFEQVVRNWKG
jgi:Domain of unknown function (DUF4760)